MQLPPKFYVEPTFLEHLSRPQRDCTLLQKEDDEALEGEKLAAVEVSLPMIVPGVDEEGNYFSLVGEDTTLGLSNLSGAKFYDVLVKATSSTSKSGETWYNSDNGPSWTIEDEANLTEVGFWGVTSLLDVSLDTAGLLDDDLSNAWQNHLYYHTICM